VKSFITDDFLLDTDYARELYHCYCADVPIFDYHSHLSAEKIAHNCRFGDIAELWLSEDHYKWRAMRSHGVAEEFITGKAPWREKFNAWADTVPHTAFNPLYHWTHLELLRIFGIDDLLSSESADRIYAEANLLLSEDSFSVRGILRRMNVHAVCTTDDPADDLGFHKTIRAEGCSVRILPTFRADKVISIESPAFAAYCRDLSRRAGTPIISFTGFMDALKTRHDAFSQAGCRSFDCSFNRPFADSFTESSMRTSFGKALRGAILSEEEITSFKSGILYLLGIMNAEKGWVQQYHIGPIRNSSSRMLSFFGPDAGCDTMNDEPVAKGLALMLDRLDHESKLSRTILYNLNPSLNGVIPVLCGAFQDGSFPGKMQFGPGWWFLDQKRGMIDQIESYAAMGLLSHFIGMLTDSRSFLSFTRHEYFRRILCSWVGAQILKGEASADIKFFGSMVRRISFENSIRYFGIADDDVTMRGKK
jgi:glucuronate isomerase